MPLLKIFSSRPLRVSADILHKSLGSIWKVPEDVLKVLVLPTHDMSGSEDLYVDVRAKAKPERTQDVVNQAMAEMQELFKEHGYIANIRVELAKQPFIMAKRFIGHQIGGIVNPMTDVLDIDAVLDKVDINKLLSRIDLDAALDRVDIDRHLQRVDLDALMDRVDLDQLIEKSNLEAIIYRGSSGVCGTLVDAIRVQLVFVDQYIQRFGQLSCCRKNMYLPPKPGTQKEKRGQHFPRTRTELAVAIQHRYCGVFSRISAAFIDWGVVFLVYFVLLLFLNGVIRLFVKDKDFELASFWTALILFCWKILYSVSLMLMFRRTIGMGMIGIMIINTNGNRTKLPVLFIRQFLLTLSEATLFVILFLYLIAWVRRDGRTLIDMGCCTGLVYAWDASMAATRKPKKTLTDSIDVAVFDDDMPGFDFQSSTIDE